MMPRRPHKGLAVAAALGLAAGTVLVASSSPAGAGEFTPTPIFTKVFTPDTIGPGSASTLVFTIDNSSNGVGADDLAFADTLPAGVAIADPASASTTCGPSGSTGPTVSAPAGGGTITLSDAAVLGGSTCTVSVDVTSATPGTHMNTSGDLTSSLGNSGTASDDLIVDLDLPGFTKLFTPSSVSVGDRSTLTLFIDNTANPSPVPNLDFTDVLPSGLTIADPAAASTTCGTPTVPPTLTAEPGTSTITLDANGTASFPAVAASAACTVTVDVVADAQGQLANSAALLADGVDVGSAVAALEATITTLALTKEFTDDPVPPGGTVTLDFEILNRSRTSPATGVGFTDALPAGALLGSLLSNDCGGTVTGIGTSTITLSGATVAAEGSCTISTSLTVPGGTASGTYTNTTGAITGTINGDGTTGNSASDLLFVSTFPLLTKEFTDDPVGAGDSVTLEFTITNTSSTSTMSGIEFIDELTDPSGEPGAPPGGFLPFPVSVDLPAIPDPPCGGGSSLALVSAGTDRQALELTGGSLAAGVSCTFEVTVDIPADFPAGTYTNTTRPIFGTVDATVFQGPVASDDIVIVAAPRLTKEFTDDPVDPGGTVNLQFTLEHDALAPGDATAITFTDDLDAAMTGLVATGLPISACGGTLSGSAGNSFLTFSGGSLTPGATCTIDVTLAVPAGAPPGSSTNTTSDITATVLGTTATGPAASDDLQISTVVLTKEFLENPYIAGEAGTLRFTVDNQTAEDATITFFTDNLQADLTGLAATGAPTSDTCGGTASGTTFLTYIGGAVPAGTSCTIDVPILVPAGAADGTYNNTTSTLSSTLATSGPQTSAPAVDDIVVESSLLALSKEFTDDPVAPGDSVTLEFTITNLSATDDITDISFDDDLDAALSGLVTTGAVTNTCGGMATSAFPTGLFEYDGGTLDAGLSCTIALTVDVPSGPLPGSVFTNTTTAPAGLVGLLDVGGDPASDDLIIQTLQFDKAFTAPAFPGTSTALEFTITNLDSAAGATGLSFSDDLDAVIGGLVASGLPSDPCGAGSTVSGSSFLSVTGGSLAPGGVCTFSVDVDVPTAVAPGSYPNVTSELFSFGLPVADPASASLTIEPPPAFAKVFAPDTIPAAATSTLTFTIDNGASTQAATSLDFTDVLPAGLVVADAPASSTTCTGGTVTAVAGSGTIGYTGGSVAAGASCTVTADVTTTSPSAYVNTSGDLTSSSGNSGTATDTLTVTALPAPTVTIDQASGQDDPTNSAPIEFTVVFNVPVTGFAAADVAVANGTVASVTPVGAATYTVAVTPTANGVVSATVPAGAADGIDGTPSAASTSTDNEVTFDDTPPVITTPDSPVTETAPFGSAGTEVDYVVTATDGGDTARVPLAQAQVGSANAVASLACAPAPGSFFPIGTTTVTCNAADDAGNTATASFDVQVVAFDDDEPPVFGPAPDLDITIPAGNSGVVDYALPTATDNSGGDVTVVCSPPPGSVFPVGTTTVTCTATDESGNTATLSFTITVRSVTLPATGGSITLLNVGVLALLAGLLLLGSGRRRRPKLTVG